MSDAPRRLAIFLASLAAMAFMAAAPALAQDADALFAQGQRYLANDNRIDARAALRQACELDHAQACKAYGDELNVGSFFGDAQLVEARYWAYGRACDLGDGEGCMKLGNARTPLGLFGAPRTPENWAGSAAAFRRACDAHQIAEGCARADEILGHGSNPHRDAQAGLTYRDRACELGSQAACHVSANERAAANVRAREAAAIEEHERLYGPASGRVAVDQAFYDVLEQILRSDGRTTWSQDKVTALRRHVLADGAVDDQERSLIVEMTVPRVRVFTIYPSSQPDPFSGQNLTTSTVSGEALRSALLALLDHTPSDLDWDDDDRQGSLRRIAAASLETPDLAGGMKDRIADQVRPLAGASTVTNGYGPMRALIADMLSAANAMQADGSVDEAGYNAVRQLFHDAIEDGVEGAPEGIPRFLYNWLRPPLGAPMPAANGARPPREGQ
ncbi:hypothetical protein F1654_05040 [Alkalicaulis satelles]|uniref:Beta-lactamase n=1 Tax=Alkalicaulis satelles TaxID=2609175 RepID=A0A5M6ZKI7_9PROT|nr:hypothetical protein [Alkalicaulis satelles]KAA5805346.1 hypothetical protein F1654_05040 [Alkalicaulis satelles]